MKKKYKEKFVDDGRTIANMNVDGMPWYNPQKEDYAPSDKIKKEPPSAMETLSIMKGVTLAALLVAGVFVIGFALFILFCVFVWFK